MGDQVVGQRPGKKEREQRIQSDDGQVSPIGFCHSGLSYHEWGKSKIGLVSYLIKLEQNKIKNGTVIAMVAAGIGYAWAANVIKWGN